MGTADATTGSDGAPPLHAEVRPAVYWFWTEIPSAQSSQTQLREMAAAGFSTVLIQTRLGFPREQYLSAAYLDAYRTAVMQAAELGLMVGVYDEYAWISGHGGGRTVAGADHLRERHLFWSTSTDAEPRTAVISDIDSWWIDGFGGPEREWLYENGARRWDRWELVAGIAHPPRGGAGSAPHTDPGPRPVDITAHLSLSSTENGCTVTLDPGHVLPEGWVLTVYVSARCASSRMVNYLDPRTAERFIEVAYEPYAQALRGLLGDPVAFFSFDHPYGGFYEWTQGKGAQIGNSLMWNAEIQNRTATIADRPLAETLHEIIHGSDPQSQQTRIAFFSRYSELGIESFFGTLRRWADAHGVGLSGHELLAHVGGWDLNGAFPEVDARTNFGLDYFSVDRHRTATLVDASNFAAQISPKFGDSLARAHGRSRCVVEQYAARNDGPGHYAAGYWELRLDELRLQTLRHHLLGARQLIFHAYGQSDGTSENCDVLTNPRFDFPPTCNHEPWFTHVRAYADESASVSAFIDGADPVHDVALVYPLHTTWAQGPRHHHSALVGGWAELLARHGTGFDLVDDRALAEATVADTKITIGANTYRTVILAGATALPSPRCRQLLDELTAQGGTAIITDTVPDHLPPQIAHRDTPFIVEIDHAAGQHTHSTPDPTHIPGTLWTWQGRTPDGAARLAILNDGPQTLTVRVVPADDPPHGATVILEPEQVACLQHEPDTPIMVALADDVPKPGPVVAQLTAGWNFHTGDPDDAAPIDIVRGWEQQGFPRFSGAGTYSTTFDLPPETHGQPLVLELPEVHCATSVTLNGTRVGGRGWSPFRFALDPGILRPQGNQLTVTVTNTAANRYYAGTPFQAGLQPSGITAAPILRTQSTEEHT